MKRFSVHVKIDRPIGARHPKHPQVIYPINYGFVPGLFAPDGEEQDVYIMGVNEPIESFYGDIIAVIKREDDCEDKWVAAAVGAQYTAEEIAQAVDFQERFHISQIELTQEWKQMNEKEMQLLLECAWKAQKNSYAPHSRFYVGAAVMGEDGNIYSGCNIENISFGLTVCGERCALFNMVSAGVRRFKGMACVTSGDSITTSCGACRQVMAEFALDADVPVVFAANCEGELRTTVGELLPYNSFDAINRAKD